MFSLPNALGWHAESFGNLAGGKFSEIHQLQKSAIFFRELTECLMNSGLF
jgi:hypothetical protein